MSSSLVTLRSPYRFTAVVLFTALTSALVQLLSADIQRQVRDNPDIDGRRCLGDQKMAPDFVAWTDSPVDYVAVEWSLNNQVSGSTENLCGLYGLKVIYCLKS